MAVPGGHELAEQLAALARWMQAPESLQETLDVIVRAAVAEVPGAEHASILTVEQRRHVRTLAASSEVARAVDRGQRDTGQGPCLDALYEERTVRAVDLAADDRWPDFATRARQWGIGSMLAIQLYVTGENLGALNLLNAKPDAFDEESEELARLFGAHAAVAMVDATKQENLSIALSSRDVIGQAKGILMERHKLTADEAFRLLIQSSQQRGRKLREVAEELTVTGELPSRPPHS